MSVEAGAFESLVLRRVSRASFPFLVSTDTAFSLRAMSIRTPQVVLVESGVVTQIVDSVTGMQTHGSSLRHPRL